MTKYNFGITGKGRFFVYPFEANLGKTYTLINTLKSMHEWMPEAKTLVVSKFKGEGNHIASSLPNAIAVNTDNNKFDEDDLEKYHVVVITHQKYRILEYQYGIKVSKDKVLMKLEMLKKYFNNPRVIASNKTLYTYDNSIEYFTLDNNIILDASAKFHSLYSISDVFQVINADRIVDHSSWTVHICLQNSTAYHKHHNDDFYKDVINFILNHYDENDQVLLLGLEEDTINLKNEFSKTLDEINIAMENFQAMRGKNEWEDFNKCIIIHNPAMSNAYYAFEYMLYTGKELTDEDLSIQKIGRNMGFKNNSTLESLRKTDIVSNIYQGLKRINRGTERFGRKADVYILNSDEEIHKLIIEQLKDVNINEVSFHAREKLKKPREQKGYRNEKRKENSKIPELEKLFSEISSGTYDKNQIASQINYSPSNLSKLLKDDQIKDIVKERGIEIKHKTIIVP